MVPKNSIPEFSSFKDPDSQVFIKDGKIYRRINKSYLSDYEKLMNSGLYTRLQELSLLISHSEIERTDDYIIIEPKKVFISYPWEWCFSQIKDAALKTLEIQKIALEYDMTLKDANYFNIQFADNKPVLIDTASFESYKEGEPWCAYRQFCENFLTVLTLMSMTDLRLKNLILSNIEGIPLDLASKLLPFKSRFNLGILMHIHMHSKVKNKYAGNKKKVTGSISKEQLKIFIDNLYNTVVNINLPKQETEWGNYYSFTNYTEKGFNEKKTIIKEWYDEIEPESVIDFGANTGVFSRLFTESRVYSLDIDEHAVEYNYNMAKQSQEVNIVPLVFDILNPSPAVGCNNSERTDLITRTGEVSLISALALVHHLRITGNIPFKKQAEYFKNFGEYLIVEYVDKSDSQVERMLVNRKDVYEDYSVEGFETSFSFWYDIINKQSIPGSNRNLYLMKRK